MSRISTSTTNVDRRLTERVIGQPVEPLVGPSVGQWANPVVKVVIRQVTPEFRRDHEDVAEVARWAAVAYLMDGRCVVWLTDADEGVGCLITTARTLASQDGVRFVGPDAVCAWCGSPLADQGRTFCVPDSSRDCEALYRGRETTWRERNLQPRRSTLPSHSGSSAGSPARSSAAWAVSSSDLDDQVVS